jgi:hypothetical protein
MVIFSRSTCPRVGRGEATLSTAIRNGVDAHRLDKPASVVPKDYDPNKLSGLY